MRPKGFIWFRVFRKGITDTIWNICDRNYYHYSEYVWRNSHLYTIDPDLMMEPRFRYWSSLMVNGRTSVFGLVCFVTMSIFHTHNKWGPEDRAKNCNWKVWHNYVCFCAFIYRLIFNKLHYPSSKPYLFNVCTWNHIPNLIIGSVTGTAYYSNVSPTHCHYATYTEIPRYLPNEMT